jgi:nucleoside-diphosphate-sugar epimerase
LLQQEFTLRALVRNPDRATGLPANSVDWVQGDLFDNNALGQLLRGADAVIHCAGAVRGNSQQQFERTNVEGTRHLLDAAKKQATRPRVLMLSSLVAREPELSWYSRSKAESEKILQDTGLDWTILRPPAVYGPGDEEMRAIFDWMARGIAVVPGTATARASLIHISDLVEAIIGCLQTSNTLGMTLTASDGKAEGYDWHEMAAIAECVWQRRVRVLPVPRRLLNIVATSNLQLARLFGRSAMLTPPKLRELRHPDWVVDNREISAAINWQPQISLEQGLLALRDSAL